MQRLLLATTALVGGALAATPAASVDLAAEFQDGASPVVQRQPAFAVRLAGRVRVEANVIDQDEPGMKPAGRLRDATALAAIGTATADNGLSYGFTYDVDVSSTDVNSDFNPGPAFNHRGELYLANRFGRLTMGNTFTATDSLDVGGSSVLVGRGHMYGGGAALLNGFVFGLGTVSHTRPAGLPGIPMNHDGGNTIRYATPNYGGLTVAVSYTPETTVDKDGSDIDGSGFGKFHAEDVWSVAAQYTSSYGNYTTVVYGGYEKGNRTLKDNDNGFNGIYGFHGGHHGTEMWSVGVKVEGRGAALAAGYGERLSDDSEATVATFLGPIPVTFDDDYRWFDVAASFTSGPWAISGGYAYVKRDNMDIGEVLFQEVFVPADDTPQKMHVWSVSANYRVAPGLSLAGGASFWKIKNSDFGAGGVMDLDNDATTITVATTIQF